MRSSNSIIALLKYFSSSSKRSEPHLTWLIKLKLVKRRLTHWNREIIITCVIKISRYRDIEMCRGIENVIYIGDCTRGCVCRHENISTKLCVWLRPGRRCESLIVVKLWVWAQSCQLCRTLGRVVASQSDRARITQGQHDTALPRHCPGEIQEKPNSVLPSYLKTPVAFPCIQGFLFYWPGLESTTISQAGKLTSSSDLSPPGVKDPRRALEPGGLRS